MASESCLQELFQLCSLEPADFFFVYSHCSSLALEIFLANNNPLVEGYFFHYDMLVITIERLFPN